MFHRQQRSMRRFCLGIVCAVMAGNVQAQIANVPRTNWGYYASPVDPIAARIRAEASLVRAYGEATVNMAQAREVRAQAIRQEIANSVEYAKAYWERREFYEAEK